MYHVQMHCKQDSKIIMHSDVGHSVRRKNAKHALAKRPHSVLLPSTHTQMLKRAGTNLILRSSAACADVLVKGAQSCSNIETTIRTNTNQYLEVIANYIANMHPHTLQLVATQLPTCRIIVKPMPTLIQSAACICNDSKNHSFTNENPVYNGLLMLAHTIRSGNAQPGSTRLYPRVSSVAITSPNTPNTSRIGFCTRSV